MTDALVYIVDDDPDMRDSLAWLMKTVGLRTKTFSSAAGFLRDFTPNGPGCVLLDVRMPGTSGLDLFEELVARGDGLPVIFITAYADVPMAVRAIKSGAVEFVEKPFNRQTLLDKVQRAIKEDADRHSRRAQTQVVQAKFRSLTRKEREVIELVKQGLPNKEIATRLDITLRAVELRRSNLMRKLGVRSLAELLRLTLAHEPTSSDQKEPRRDAAG
jgi:two-component system, LuxR family, response regulator FixJ